MIGQLEATVRRILVRREAYRRTLAADNRDAAVVLADLRRFCHADRPVTRLTPVSGAVDPYATCVAAGRLEVWQRIEKFLTINDADLAKIQEAQENINAAE